MKTYEIIVGNIGSVYYGTNPATAQIVYDEYIAQSQARYGRASGESVHWMVDGDLEQEMIGSSDEEG